MEDLVKRQKLLTEADEMFLQYKAEGAKRNWEYKL